MFDVSSFHAFSFIINESFSLGQYLDINFHVLLRLTFHGRETGSFVFFVSMATVTEYYIATHFAKFESSTRNDKFKLFFMSALCCTILKNEYIVT